MTLARIIHCNGYDLRAVDSRLELLIDGEPPPIVLTAWVRPFAPEETLRGYAAVAIERAGGWQAFVERYA